jgi:hypothetical protein
MPAEASDGPSVSPCRGRAWRRGRGPVAACLTAWASARSGFLPPRSSHNAAAGRPEHPLHPGPALPRRTAPRRWNAAAPADFRPLPAWRRGHDRLVPGHCRCFRRAGPPNSTRSPRRAANAPARAVARYRPVLEGKSHLLLPRQPARAVAGALPRRTREMDTDHRGRHALSAQSHVVAPNSQCPARHGAAQRRPGCGAPDSTGPHATIRI